MFAGALIDLGADPQNLKNAIQSLNLNDFEISIEKTIKSGINSTKFEVKINHHEHVHRHLSDIERIINESPLSEYVKTLAKKMFGIVAAAEGKVHGLPPEEVHFHEVGAADSIADIVSAAVLIENLRVQRIVSSPLNVGGGSVRCAHGILPVPAPATAEILSGAGIPFKTTSAQDGELVTPSGAAILAAVCTEYGEMPLMTVERIGNGAGTRELSHPNILRAFLGDTYDKSEGDSIEILETNIDDTSGEALGGCLDALMREGAADAYFTPIFMKKNRPAYMLTVLCSKEFTKRAAEIIFERTGSIGLRVRTSRRIIMRREIRNINTQFGGIPVKFSTFGDVKKYKAEAEFVERAANANNIPPSRIYAEIISEIEQSSRE
ncbi:MAG TPA: nickel pincer cofactor biosynthesis protein LarC [Ruminiclostridium sp.]|nr:nickel pincer cofactor biosynthesis protein LarC [Ruminiclostridium sp.]